MASKTIKMKVTFNTLCLGNSAKLKELLLKNIPDIVLILAYLKLVNLLKVAKVKDFESKIDESKIGRAQCLIILMIKIEIIFR